MSLPAFQKLFQKDLDKLRKEIESYQNEAAIWQTAPGISNAAGNLCLHLVGNLNTFIGAELGKTSYIRDRPLEFSLTGISKAELLTKIDETIAVVTAALGKLTEKQLTHLYPVVVFEEKMQIGDMLTYLATHLNYHLGQINYHRRLMDKA